MIPQNMLAPSPVISAFFSPDGDTSITELLDLELGGIGLNDPSQGLQVQTWQLSVDNLLGTFTISSDTQAPLILFTRSNPTWARLAFDQNMHPFISFVDQTGAHFYWWDPTIPGNTITDLSAGIQFPCCSMDDKREIATLMGWNDIILAYILNNNLYFRAQQDRYTVEYLLYTDLTKLVAAPRLWKIGMNSLLRLQFAVQGVLYGT